MAERKRKTRRRPKPEHLELIKATRVVLATAHRDHDPTNNNPLNLRGASQRCHLAQDRGEHQRRRRLTLLQRKALGDLFLGSYSG